MIKTGISVSEAQKNILEHTKALSKTEDLTLQHAYRRRVAKDYQANVAVPPSDNSAMDGYAISTSDTVSMPTSLFVSQRIAAGDTPSTLQQGTAARIFTGATIPPGADAVVIQENCKVEGDKVILSKPVSPGANIRLKAQDIAPGTTLFRAGHMLQAPDIGLLASVGITDVKVFARPRVALLSTGNELLKPGETLQPGKIFNSNRPMLQALLTQSGCEVIDAGIVRDTHEETRAIFNELKDCVDLIITTGGVSVGEEDHVRNVVAALGDIELWKIRLKPGKPLTFGSLGAAHVMGLPGNPVSAYICYLLFALPLIRTLNGEKYTPPQPEQHPLLFSIDKPRSRPEYMRVRITDNGIEKFANQSSGVLTSLSWANALALIPSETTLKQGDAVSVFPLDSFF